MYQIRVVGLLVLGLLLFSSIHSQQSGQALKVFDGVGIEERLGQTIPRGLLFTDERGQRVALETFFDGKTPVLLNLVYYSCPMLCNLVLDEQTATLSQMQWTPGKQYRVITVSFADWDTPQMARDHKNRYLKQLGKADAGGGWRFLTGDRASIAALTKSVGFKYRWVEERKEYAHPAALIFLSGDGKITRYLYGLSHTPRDVRTALVEASQGKVGNVLDQVILFCFQYDHEARGYVLYARNVMKAGGLLTLLALGALLTVLWRRERHRLRPHPSAT